MKYFTLDWYHDTLVSQMCFSLRKSTKAAKLSDKFFESLYKKEKNFFVKYSKRVARFAKVPFDAKAAEMEFDNNYKTNLDFVSTLPTEITSKIADMRVFALGTVEHSMADEITRYCGKVNRQCEQISEDYKASLEVVSEKLGRIKIDDLYLLEEAEIKSVNKVSDDLVIYSASNEFEITLKNFSGDSTDDLRSAVIIANEITLNDDESFTFGLLCESIDGNVFETSFKISDFEIIGKK